jgi:hypothetical protein
LFDFPAVKSVYKLVIKIVIGINNSTTLIFIATISYTDNSNAVVCPMVKSDTKRKIRFQSLKENGTVNAIKNKT